MNFHKHSKTFIIIVSSRTVQTMKNVGRQIEEFVFQQGPLFVCTKNTSCSLVIPSTKISGLLIIVNAVSRQVSGQLVKKSPRRLEEIPPSIDFIRNGLEGHLKHGYVYKRLFTKVVTQKNTRHAMTVTITEASSFRKNYFWKIRIQNKL